MLDPSVKQNQQLQLFFLSLHKSPLARAKKKQKGSGEANCISCAQIFGAQGTNMCSIGYSTPTNCAVEHLELENPPLIIQIPSSQIETKKDLPPNSANNIPH